LIENDAAGARKSIEEVLIKNPEDTAALYLLVQSYQLQHQMRAALQAVRRYADEKPTSARIHHFLGQLLLEAGTRSEARKEFQAVKSSHPAFVPAALDVAQLDIADGKWEEAAKSLSEIVEAHPANLQAQLLMGAVQENRKNLAEAVGHFRKALELDGRNMMALNNLAYILLEYANQPDEGLMFAQKAAEVAPDSPVVQDTLGWAFYRKGMYADAVKYLERAASKQQDSTTKLHLGSALVKVGEQTRGVQMLQSALAMDPKIAEAKAFREIMGSGPLR
jgi:Flp pilus assembly protein TadD